MVSAVSLVPPFHLPRWFTCLPLPSDKENSIFANYASGINFDKYDNILVTVSGDNPPQAIMTFDEAALCETLSWNVGKSGYVKPAPVIKYSIPITMAGMAADFLKTDYLFLPVVQVGGACSDVEQNVVQVTKSSKRDMLMDVLKTTGTECTMVFVETKRKADFIAGFLCQENISTTSKHGDWEQLEKGAGPCRLPHWEVPCPGGHLCHRQRPGHRTLNFDLPSSIDEYVHRIGRTGQCGNTGRAMSFFDPEADTPLARSLVKVLSGAQQEVPLWLEELAEGAHVTTGIKPRWKGFASTDTRKVCASIQFDI
ncbi:hypothetical protein AAFF_G00143250 [Aldrovandia affinis]|uniref:Helicase C-terminal domain-containing protein n=1 Tax=Aldrovandia affinis TaxID=143900 RepID=A0AAD7T0E7_9TELE|nr:hypothetical protein AAFF_G00143250 [Aldrovandia affinis]